jgi:hypothetical protein
MLAINTIEFIKDLVQLEYEGTYYDFHNGHDCENILYEKSQLTLVFKNKLNNTIIHYRFLDVIITKMFFFNVENTSGLTLISLYRGRTEVNNELVDSLNGELSYMYLEFDEGQNLEFWSSYLEIQK